MARPIEPTPVLSEEDSRALLASLEPCASKEEMARRRAAARRWFQEVTRPKGFPRTP